jgi:hypothetical protein
VGISARNTSLIEANVVDRCQWGIYVEGYNRVHGNILNASFINGITAPGPGNLVTGNQLSLNGGCAMSFGDPSSGRGGNTGSGTNATAALCPSVVFGGGQLIACDLLNALRTFP